jgi:hypothetical protein
MSLALRTEQYFSGATLLTMLLQRHSEIVTNRETYPGIGQIKTTTCSCGDSIELCAFYTFAASRMRSPEGFDPDLFSWVPRFSFNATLNRLLGSTRVPGLWKSKAARLVPGITDRISRIVEAQKPSIPRPSSILMLAFT